MAPELSAPRVVWCGVGALGSNTVVLCRNLAAQHVFIDGDRVESKNLLAQAWVKQSVGKNKAEALKTQLLNFYGLKTEALGVRLTGDNVGTLLSGAALVVDCFDNMASRSLLAAHCRQSAQPLVHAGLSGDGTVGLVRWAERFTPDPEDHAGQATCEDGAHLPLVALVAATLARTVQDFLKAGARHDALVSLNGSQRT